MINMIDTIGSQRPRDNMLDYDSNGCDSAIDIMKDKIESRKLRSNHLKMLEICGKSAKLGHRSRKRNCPARRNCSTD